jgi:hypothetical protein
MPRRPFPVDAPGNRIAARRRGAAADVSGTRCRGPLEGPDYLAAWINDLMLGTAQEFMYVVGGIEIAAGLATAFGVTTVASEVEERRRMAA